MSTDELFWEMKYKQKDQIVVRHIAGETILVPVRNNISDMQSIFTLTGVGEYIWSRLDGNTDLLKIHENLLDDFEVEQEQAELDIKEFIDELIAADLIIGV